MLVCHWSCHVACACVSSLHRNKTAFVLTLTLSHSRPTKLVPVPICVLLCVCESDWEKPCAGMYLDSRVVVKVLSGLDWSCGWCVLWHSETGRAMVVSRNDCWITLPNHSKSKIASNRVNILRLSRGIPVSPPHEKLLFVFLFFCFFLFDWLLLLCVWVG